MASVQEKQQIADDKPVDFDTEKADAVIKLEDTGRSSDTSIRPEYEPLSDKEFKRLRWKLDLRIVPFCGVLYLCSFLDRSNIGNAKIAGITEDLHISEDQYNIALSIFFIGYVIFEIPSNIMLKKIGPNLWIPLVMVSFAGLLATRFFLGGVIFYMTLWYTRREIATRISLFFGCSTLAGAFGGVLAYGIMQMDGMRGLHGWQWIFIIEAIPTLFLACITYFVLPNLPENSKALNERERAHIVNRLLKDAGPATETHFSMKQLRMAFTDWKIYMHSFIYIVGSIPLYSMSLFLPSIIRGMGFETLEAQAMSAPPYAIACVVTILVAMDADRQGERAYHLAIPSFFGMIGYILLIACRDQGPVALYIAACITVTGVFAHAPPMLSWFTGNIGGHTKRAVGSAIVISIGNAGGVVGGQVYRANDAPHYVTAHSVCAVLLFIQVCTTIGYKFALKRINNKRDNMTPEERRIACEGEELCDAHPDFRYIT
ncbi:major facilitator superfamily domain-containing protein [Zychaea mexicana]|uniref:major facilitator superfamily domain-containing protein n=1 Tax=Zychaea mexicana TaxID=64656 RepID=UPI0022FE1011|nr:major facilitator superfamily domain-containing protein [Zychaea mexicana]KAI9490720.1 major facilitator superfamily domain-containing protein [Zychaea mexicana]